MLNAKLKNQFSKLIANNKKFVICGHQGPDGDVIGSTLAMSLGLKKLGKKVLPFNQDGCPKSLMFLPQSNLIKNDLTDEFTDAVLVTVDSGDLLRIGKKISKAKFKEIINVDHHKSNTRFGTHNFIDIKAGSTGQVVVELLQACRGFKLTKDIAQNVFCTLSTDTGSFRYSNSTPEVFNLASVLVKAGAKPDVISQALYETYSQKRLFLLQKVLQSLRFEYDGRLAKMYLTLSDLKECGASLDDSEEFINFPRGVSGVKVVALFKENSPKQWKLSLRSRDNVDVLKIAQEFGGGGHKLAAGCTINLSLDEAEKKFEGIMEQLGSLK
ncbi:MAG: bifunctional oligoribonuclease/PAP phosphatase NrnA [Oligoflexia bacterium]|nr:bifunctional oligoribonuclease/PAP phosphatase NrnA [Oligoflexia bacterium]